MKNGHGVPSSWEEQDEVEKSRRQLSLHPKCRGLPLAEHRATWRAGSTLSALCCLHLTCLFLSCCSVWCPSAKQNELVKVGQMVLPSLVYVQLQICLIKPRRGGGGDNSICYFQGTSVHRMIPQGLCVGFPPCWVPGCPKFTPSKDCPMAWMI